MFCEYAKVFQWPWGVCRCCKCCSMCVNTNTTHTFPLPFCFCSEIYKGIQKIGWCGRCRSLDKRILLCRDLSKKIVFLASNWCHWNEGTSGNVCGQIHLYCCHSYACNRWNTCDALQDSCIMRTQRVAVKWEGEILELYHCTFIAC